MTFNVETYLWKKTFQPGRPLAEKDRQYHLAQERRLAIEHPRPQMGLIKVNSTYLELTDFFSRARGAFTLVGTIACVIFTVLLGAMLWASLADWVTGRLESPGSELLFLVFMFALLCPVIWIFTQVVRLECFRLTHYPIRLNRRNRMVYVLRRDGTLLVTPWSSLYFTKHFSMMGIQGDLWAHVLMEDGLTIQETIPFFNVTGEPAGADEVWEYLRRYMEESPKAASEEIHRCLPIWDRKESALFGFFCLISVINGNLFSQFLMSPFFCLMAIGRYAANLTCQIPVWPPEVEEACAIDAGDPYAKDWRSNDPIFKFIKQIA